MAPLTCWMVWVCPEVIWTESKTLRLNRRWPRGTHRCNRWRGDSDHPLKQHYSYTPRTRRWWSLNYACSRREFTWENLGRARTIPPYYAAFYLEVDGRVGREYPSIYLEVGGRVGQSRSCAGSSACGRGCCAETRTVTRAGTVKLLNKISNFRGFHQGIGS